MEKHDTILKPGSRSPMPGNTFLRKDNYLGEFITESEKARARKNLGIIGTGGSGGSGGGSDFNGNLQVMNLINNGNFLFDLKGWTLS